MIPAKARGTYDAADALSKHVHHLWSLIGGLSFTKKGVEAFVQNDQSQVIYAAYMIVWIASCLDP